MQTKKTPHQRKKEKDKTGSGVAQACLENNS
jgi:hypothetical protein